MFRGTSVANPSVASWDVSSVIDFSNMFKNAAVAQPDVSSWNTANGIDMSGMFSGSFTSVSGGYPNIKAWNVSSVQDMSSMLDGIRLPTMEYDELLNNFNAQSLHSSVVFDAGISEYCKANNSRTWLSSDSNGSLAWTIHDGGSNCYDYYLTEILEDSSSPGGANNANGSRITAAELADITGIVYYVFPEFESDYQNVIAAKDDFSNPPTIEEIQSVLSEVSAKNIVLWHSSSSGRNSAVQFIPLNNEIIRNIPGVTNVEPNNEDFYLRLITVESAFSDLPNTEHVQAIVDKANSWANAVREVLEDSQSAGGASNANGSEVSFSEISAIVGLNGLASNNISHYRQAFSVHSGFSNPPSVGQIQTIVNSVNAKVEALEDSNSINGASNANGIYLSVGQLASIAGLTGISYSNAQYYNTAISAQSNFDNLPTTSQLQGVIDTANATASADLSPSDASQIALLEILEDSASAGGAVNTNGVKVSILQISAVQGITNLVFSNEQAYRAAISNKSDFGNLPTLLEVQNLINSVNVSQESMAAVLEDSPSPGGASNADSVEVQFSQLSNIVGLQNIDQNSIDYYVQLIRKKTDLSNLPTVAEIQNIIDEGNRIANSVAAILEDSASPGGAENTDGLLVNSEDLAGISLLDNILPQYDTYYRQGIAAKTNFSKPPSIEEIQNLVDYANDWRNQDHLFVFTINIPFTPFRSASKTFRIPSGNQNYGLHWEDMDVIGRKSSEMLHVTKAGYTLNLPLAGRYRIAIDPVNVPSGTNDFSSFRFDGGSDSSRLIEIEQWGSTVWSSMDSAFLGASSLQKLSTVDVPNLSQVTSTSRMFENAANLVSTGTLDHWDFSEVVDMSNMFADATQVNPDTSVWNVENVENFSGMFLNASNASPDVSNWNVVKARSMDAMFSGAQLARPELAQWDFSNVESMNNIFDANVFNTEMYDQLLMQLNTQDTQRRVTFSASESTYCRAQDARTNLLDSKAWSIVDAGRDCSEYVLSEVLEDSSSVGGSSNQNGKALSGQELLSSSSLQNVILANERDYQRYIATDFEFVGQITVEVVQDIIDSVNSEVEVRRNSVAGLSEALEDSNSTAGARNANDRLITAEQLKAIIGLENVVTANLTSYQVLISQNEEFSNPPELVQLQDLIDTGNISESARAKVLEDSLSGDRNSDGVRVTVVDLQSIVGIFNIEVANELRYQLEISRSEFSQPPTNSQIQRVIDSINDYDGDGISNLLEQNADTDIDGLSDEYDLDSDNDGIPDAIEGASDADNDGIDNYRDRDSDNDGIFDLMEGQSSMQSVAGLDIDLNGAIDPGNAYGSNGLLDQLETEIDSGTLLVAPTDTDNDGLPDYLDADADNDGVLDAVEGNARTSGGSLAGSSANSPLQIFGLLFSDETSVDATGISPTAQGLPLDTDNDGIANIRDKDSDNDGLLDVVESFGPSYDLDNDGQIDGFSDADRNGIADALQINAPAVVDTDNDGLLDQMDIDSDGDGLSDIAEYGGVDDNNDGMIDNLIDLNRDGIDDVIATLPVLLVDSDGDGEPDYRDSDSDNDGVSDLIESGGIDADGDGIADGLISLSSLPDVNRDGIADHLQVGSGPLVNENESPEIAEAVGASSGGSSSLTTLLILFSAAMTRRRKIGIGKFVHTILDGGFSTA
ncbi:BspA family leucine-rich repeat surface protein [Granulosicoccus sp.]|nr:BspA family leucine-rich repeat surface protein [Granulosicoccus sp.]MDB4224650.1 BspA family leucine-rich repeat surface protein [Granulosicoccus sp.]